MKKFLLSAAVAVMAVASASATTDGVKYATVDGVSMTNNWVLDRAHNFEAAFKNSPLNGATRARTAVMAKGKVYVAQSEAKQAVYVNDEGKNDTVMQALVHVYDVKTGAFEKSIPVTLDGKPYGAFLGVNQIGTDSFGHLWVAPYTSEKTATIPVYQFDPATGALTLVADLSKGDKIARTDYFDVIGDITRKEAECTMMTPGTQVETVYRWHADKDGDFEGGFDGDTYLDITEFYPESCTQWSYGPVARIVLGDSDDNLYAGELFYIDGFNSAPLLYQNDGSLAGSFEGVDASLFPAAGTNGVAEFHLGDASGENVKNFIVYSMYQYDNHGCQANICELGENSSLAGMKKYWQTDSLGGTSDGGNRIHSLNVEYSKDSKGNDVVTLFSFKSNNGMAVYTISMGGESGVNGVEAADAALNVEGNVVKVSAPAAIEVYNVAGQKVAAANGTELTINGNGAYIVKAVVAGKTLTKKVVL